MERISISVSQLKIKGGTFFAPSFFIFVTYWLLINYKYIIYKNIEEEGVLEKQLRFWDWDYESKKIGLQKSPNSLKSNNLRRFCGFIFSVSTLPIIPKTLQNHSFWVSEKPQNCLVFSFKVDRTMLKYIKIKNIFS